MLHSKFSKEHHILEYIPDGVQLPEGSCYQLVDRINIGVPKKTIAKAFLTAHRIFFACLDDVKTHAADLMDSSMIILLFDPEHLTAANVRKKILVLEEEKDVKSKAFARLLGDELWLSELFLMSKLKRHNKSPTLWSHRKWLMKKYYKKLCPTPRVRHIDGNEVMVLVTTSGDNHPRNYYAWDYLRWFLKFRPPVPDEDIDVTESDEEEEYLQGKSLWDLDEDGMKTVYLGWCFEHTSDISGWAFLRHLLGRFYYKSGSHGWILKAWIANEVLVRAQTFGLKQESLWWFLSMMAREGKMCNVPQMQKYVDDFMIAVRRFHRNEPDGSPMNKFAKRELKIELQDNMRELYYEQMAGME